VFTWNNFENSKHFLVFNNNTQQKFTTKIHNKNIPNKRPAKLIMQSSILYPIYMFSAS
jgi:hypothetical protein